MSVSDEYLIKQVLGGHKEDVRSVAAYPGGGFVTGSRDRLARLFQLEDSNDPTSSHVEAQKFVGSTHFISKVCYGRTKSGQIEIYVGSHDMNIYVYTLMESAPIDTLIKHTGPVCSLAFRICNEKDVLISGSWDSTVIIWLNKIPSFTLIGHTYSVWSVAFVARSFVLTGGADKLIKKWDVNNGQNFGTFEGHKECVRGLAVINGQQFLSCSNDATVILWSMDGTILKTFEGHENFIFDICIVRPPIKTGEETPKQRPFRFVTVSEDKSVRIWDKETGCIQKIPLDITTLWSCINLDSGDFVVGASDGNAYVFSNKITTPAKTKTEDPKPSVAGLTTSTEPASSSKS